MTPRALSFALLTFLTACQSDSDPLELSMRGKKFDPKTDTEPSYPDPQPTPDAGPTSTCPALPEMLVWGQTYVAPAKLFTTTRPGAVTIVENDPAAPDRLIAYGVGVSPTDGAGEVVFRLSLPASAYETLATVVTAELGTLDGGANAPGASKATSYGILKVGGVPVGPGPGGGGDKLRRVVDVAVGVAQPQVQGSTPVILSASPCN